MSLRQTAFWLVLAVGLFGFIFFFHRQAHKNPQGPERILPHLRFTDVTEVQVRPAGTGQIELKIVAERTNNTWRLTEPLPCPAQAASVEDLVAALEELTAIVHIPESQIRSHPKAEAEYGLASPQASVIISQGNDRTIVHIGSKTSPGDQVYLEVVGIEGAYVVDADLLRHLPRSANDWRDTTLLSLDQFAFDRIAITNNAAAFVTILQRDTNTHLWRMAWPLRARADSTRIEESLQRLGNLRIRQFVSDDPKADLEAFGLAPPELELTLAAGTNNALSLQFGKALTNDANQVFAKRPGQTSIFTVAKDLIAAWRASAKDNFRDPILLRLDSPVDAVEIRGEETSSLRQTNNTWRILPEDLPADPVLANELLSTLGNLHIVGFIKDVVNPPDLPDFGLANPARKFILQAADTNSALVVSNSVLAELDFGFGTNQPDKVFARRIDENSVYAISTNDFARLPSAAWQVRDRHLWQISTNDIARVTIEQKGQVRQLVRNAIYDWSLAPGSQGILPNVLAVEDTVRGLAQAAAVAWVAHGQENCARFGFKENAYRITLELKDGQRATISFGTPTPSNNIYAAVTFSGQPWVLEFPWLLYRDVVAYLSIPAKL